MHKYILKVLYGFWVRWFLKIIIGVQYGKRPDLEGEQFIILGNHNSHLDTMTLMSAIPSDMVHLVRPIAAEDHFGKTKLKSWFTRYFINSILIQRKRDKENPENDPINKMVKALDEGYSLILFPEGTRGEPEKLQKLKPGVGMVLSQRPNIKYVTAYMTGLGKALPKNEKLLLPYNSTLAFGELKKVQSTDVGEIMEEIEREFGEMMGSGEEEEE